MTKIAIPQEILRVSWAPNYMFTNVLKSVGPGKMVGITVKRSEATIQQHHNLGVTHIQNLVAPSEPFEKKWANYRAENMASPTEFANQFSAANNNLSKHHGYGGQVQEDGFSPAQGRECFGRVFDKLVEHDPSITSPADTWIIGDYFQPLPGGKLAKAFGDSSQYQKHRDNLASEASCRLEFNDGENNFGGTAEFYTDGWGYNKQNGQIPANYLNSWAEIRLGVHVFQLLFDLVKSRGGCTNRRLISYDFPSYDNANFGYIRGKVAVRFDSPAGYIHVVEQWKPIPWEIMKQRAFFFLLLGDGFVLWETSFTGYTDDPSELSIGYPEPQNTEWKADGQNPVAFSNGASGQPTLPADGTISPVCINYALGVGENGAFAGVFLAATFQELGLMGEYVEWVPFTYTVNGGAVQNGYKDGSSPVNGNNGNARLSSKEVPNYGESNVVSSLEARKPLVGRSKGVNGFGYFAINSFADPDAITLITLLDAGNATLELEGNGLECFTGI